MAGTTQPLEEPSKVQALHTEGEPSPTSPAGETLHERSLLVFQKISCSVHAVLYLTGLISLPWVGMLYFNTLERDEKLSVLPLHGLSISIFLNGVSWPGDIFVSPHFSALFSHLQLAWGCGTLQNTLWLMLVQPEFSHPKPCRSILKHYSNCPRWSFFSFFFFSLLLLTSFPECYIHWAL